MFSLNNRFIVEAYKKGDIRSEERNGFAFISQKLNLKGLKLLIDARIGTNSDSYIVPAGSTVYIKEETLHTQAWAQKPFECDSIKVPFLIIDVTYVELVIPAE